MFQHFGQRLKRDLKQLVDRRLDASVTASGSLQRVRFFPTRLTAKAKPPIEVFRCRGRRDQPQTPAICRMVRRIPHGLPGTSVSQSPRRPHLDLLIFQLPSPSFTASVTRRRSTTRSDPASADGIKFSEVRPRSSEIGQSVVHITPPRNESSAAQQTPTALRNRPQESEFWQRGHFGRTTNTGIA